MSVTTRLVTVADAAEIAGLLRDNREFLAPFEPPRAESYYTEEGQRQSIQDLVRAAEAGTSLPHVIVEDGRIVGRITLNTIVRGPFLSASVGYLVAQAHNGRGVGSAALARMIRLAFDELGLHRLDAATLLDNAASQRVLLRNGFQRYGQAPRYLKIAGDWRDHVLFQLLNE
jgi:ribosomal-protein-alanine N-acetyltransferase